VKEGITVGVFGAIFSYLGSRIAVWIPVHSLHFLTAGMLFLSAIIQMNMEYHPLFTEEKFLSTLLA
jgi:uncharacterized protein